MATQERAGGGGGDGGRWYVVGGEGEWVSARLHVCACEIARRGSAPRLVIRGMACGLASRGWAVWKPRGPIAPGSTSRL